MSQPLTQQQMFEMFQALMQQQQNANQQPNMMSPPNWNMPTNPYWMFFNGPPNGWNNQASGQMNVNSQSNNASNTQPQNSQDRPVIPCGVISDPSEIKPGEIPMNGGFGMFIKNDMSKIYIKQWGSDGKIDTRVFLESLEESPENPGVLDILNARFDRLEELVSNNSNRKQNNYPKNNQNKEVANNG